MAGSEQPHTSHPPPIITLRPWEPHRDAARCAELLNHHSQGSLREPHTAERLIEWHRLRPAGSVVRELTAETPSGKAVAFAEVSRAPWSPPGRFGLELLVDPAHRGQGVGSLLLDDLTAFALANGGARLGAAVRDDDATSLHFARHRGFEVERHVFESTLDLASFDDTPFAGAVAGAEASGIVFRSLADYGDSEPARRKLYELNTACARDIPGSEGPDRPYDEFKKIFESHWYRPDGQVLAVDPSETPEPAVPSVETDRFAALAAIGYFSESNSVYHMHTGVDRAYRGRGLALATKLVALRRARAWGATFARTNNDSQNAPILAVNRKLGYTPQPGFYRLLKTIA